MVGRKINNYELRELVGDGAMGVVYLAEHPVLRKRVAVKLLKRQYLESPSLVARFVNEARAAAAIHHPNIIEVIDVGMMDAEVPYIMMEYLDGEPLARRLSRERLHVGKAVDIAIQAARAVAASHALEIVHRDLKPENLFLVPDPTSPGGERVKVLDFGIAKLRPDWGGSDSPDTQTGAIFGTPAYMSPEQCRGRNDEVDAKTDIYALGCILFEMLTGQAPFVAQGWGDVLVMHMQEPVPIPSARNSNVPAWLDRLVATAMAKSKTDRFASMRDMHRALGEARSQVSDTPLPIATREAGVPSVQLGVDALLESRAFRSGSSNPLAASSAVESAAIQLRPPPRGRLMVVAVAVALVGVAAVVALAARSRARTAPVTETVPAAPPTPTKPPVVDEALPPPSAGKTTEKTGRRSHQQSAKRKQPADRAPSKW